MKKDTQTKKRVSNNSLTIFGSKWKEYLIARFGFPILSYQLNYHTEIDGDVLECLSVSEELHEVDYRKLEHIIEDKKCVEINPEYHIFKISKKTFLHISISKIMNKGKSKRTAWIITESTNNGKPFTGKDFKRYLISEQGHKKNELRLIDRIKMCIYSTF